MDLFPSDIPDFLTRFLHYALTVKGQSRKTVQEYYLDLRTFLRYIKLERDHLPKDTDFETIPVADITLEDIKNVTLSQVYDYLSFVSIYRPTYHKSVVSPHGNNAAARARKVSSLRSFFKYLTTKAGLLDINPITELESPKLRKALPHYLTLEESKQLLSVVDGRNKERDYCILTLFLNCGMRVSELSGMNLADIDRSLGLIRLRGKGNKERIVYLNDACFDALDQYLAVRKKPTFTGDADALFVSSQLKRIDEQTVKWIVKKHLAAAGLSGRNFSAHKLRHTAATLMYQNGVDIRTLQEVLGHEQLDTTKIYTHITDSNLKKAADMNPLASVSQQKTTKKNKYNNKSGQE